MSLGLSVRWRLTLFYSLVSVGSMAVLLGVVYWLVRRSRDSDVFFGAISPRSVPFEEPLPDATGPERNLIVRTRVDAVDQTLDNLLLWSGIALVVTAAVSVGIGWLFAGRVLAPVHTITQRARNISAEALDERVSLGGPPDELRELADTFDSMLDRIQAAFESERRLVATMSHELRTPLANQRAALDVTLADPEATVDELRHAAEVALGQTDRANRTVDALLTLADTPYRQHLLALIDQLVDRGS